MLIDGKYVSSFRGIDLRIKNDSDALGGISFPSLSADPTDDSSTYALYVKSGSLYYWNGASAVSLGGVGVGDDTLDSAYSNGTDITLDADAITITDTHATSNLFELRLTGSGTGNIIDIQNDTTGSAGSDIIGTGDTWSVSSAGAAVFTAVTGCDTLTAAANLAINATGTGTIGIGSVSTGAVTITPALTAVASVTITGVADTTCLTVTAGDVVVTAGLLSLDDDDTTTGNLVIPSSTATSGNPISITADDLTSGSAIYIDSDNGASFSGDGGFFNAMDGTNSVFKIQRYGATTIAGNAATNVFTITAGDVVLSDTSITMTDADQATSFSLTNNACTTSTLMLLTADGLANGIGIRVDADGGCGATGAYFDAYNGTASVFSVGEYGAVTVAGTAAGTAALTLSLGDLVITDTDTTTITSVNGTGNTVEIISGGAVGAGKGTLVIDQAGTLNATGALLRLEADGVTATNSPYAMQVDAHGVDVGFCKVDSDAATDSVMHIHCGGAVADNQALLELTWDGTPAAAGSNMLRIDGSGGTNTAKPVLVEIYDDSVSVGLTVQTASIEDMVSFIGTGATGNDKAVVDITSTGTLNVGGNLLRIDGTGATTTSKPVLLEILDDSVATGISVTSSPTANDVAIFSGGGAMTDGYAVLTANNSGNLAAGGMVMEIEVGGTPDTDARAFEISGSGKDIRGMYVDVDSATNEAIVFNLDGDLAAGKDGVLIDLGGAVSSTSSALAVKYTGSATAGAIVGEFIPVAGTLGIKVDGGGIATREALYIDADPTAYDVVYMHTDAVLADNKAVLSLHSAGAIASGSNVLRIATAGTPDTGAIVFEMDAQDDCQAMLITSSSATTDAVKITGAGNLANDKAMLLVESSATALVSGSSLVRIADSGSCASAGTTYGLEIAMDGTGLEGLYVSAGTSKFAEGVTIDAGGATVTAGNVTVTAGNVKKSIEVGITANVGSSQATGELITKDISEVAVCANGGDAVTLPAAVAGLQLFIINRGAASCDVFPASGDNINEAGADAAFALANDKSAIFTAIDGTHWEAALLARS